MMANISSTSKDPSYQFSVIFLPQHSTLGKHSTAFYHRISYKRSHVVGSFSFSIPHLKLIHVAACFSGSLFYCWIIFYYMNNNVYLLYIHQLMGIWILWFVSTVNNASMSIYLYMSQTKLYVFVWHINIFIFLG